MKKGFIWLLSAAVAMFMLHSCKKDDNNTNTGDPCDTTAEPQYWFYGTVDGESVDTRGACNSTYLELDNVFQFIEPVKFGDKYLVTSKTSFSVYQDSVYVGIIELNLGVMAPDSLVDVNISAADTTLSLPTQQFCSLLKIGELVFYQTHMVQQNKNGGYITLENNNAQAFRINPGQNPQMDVEAIAGIGQLVLNGSTGNACICQAGFSFTMDEVSGTNTLQIDGTAYLPFK